MAVRDALLALLTAGPAYGFQLHGELEARTGRRRRVNVGQTYATLDRLGKQRLVESAGATDDGLPLHRLSAAGEAAAATWLGGADAAGSDPWDETVDRVLIALSLPGADAGPIVAAERGRWQERALEASARVGYAAPPAALVAPAVPAALAALAALAAAAESARAQAALRWLDEVEPVASAQGLSFAPRQERPRRGRRPSTAPSTMARVTPDEAQASADA